MNRTRLVFIGILALAVGAFASAVAYRTLQSHNSDAQVSSEEVVVAANDSSVAGFVAPGTRVDVFMTGNPAGSNEPQTVMVLKNVAVLANGQKLDRNLLSGEAQTAPVITLLVSPDDAAKLALATNQGRIQLALRNPLDTSQADVATIHARAL